MIIIERTARKLAAELSEKGEGDWQRYLDLAREVNRRVDDDFRRVFMQGKGSDERFR